MLVTIQNACTCLPPSNVLSTESENGALVPLRLSSPRLAVALFSKDPMEW